MDVLTIDISDPSVASLEALDPACRNHSFFLIKGHGLDSIIEPTGEATERFSPLRRSTNIGLGTAKLSR